MLQNNMLCDPGFGSTSVGEDVGRANAAGRAGSQERNEELLLTKSTGYWRAGFLSTDRLGEAVFLLHATGHSDPKAREACNPLRVSRKD
jgi:hypothetical protein